MFYTLTFSLVVDGQRIPLIDAEGKEVTKQVEATSRSAAMTNANIQQFCEEKGNDTRVRRVI